ncbi:DUF3301 domain-containing protein [Lysobacter sp. TY2-98]|uniref:DUF3301 domain-containing protein n=1 Tax=Lysobacter sp. TY2-98 TaxID=2290922 RepID=UPI000E207707|nr:DUF3301 domain-containing protein [Lysobacter sp. TY2-98]AXK71469.1 DUF3301 domain-containing protein [Lysobacter sp. TY2-98]
MPTLIVMMVFTAVAVAFWNAGRAAAERARDLGRDACRAARVQWLDDSVHVIGLRPRRLESGKLGWERTFRFDYSLNGADRHQGRLVLRGDRLVSFVGPPTPEPVPFPPRVPLD